MTGFFTDHEMEDNERSENETLWVVRGFDNRRIVIKPIQSITLPKATFLN